MEEVLLKLAQVTTIKDAVELLTFLRNESSSAHYEVIDTMILRLTNMAKTL